MIKKLSKTPKLNTIWFETITRVLNMPIELKSNNYYSKMFKRVNYKLQNNTFWVVITSHRPRVSKLRICHALYWMGHNIPYMVLSKCHLIIYTYGGLIPRVHPRILPRICPRGIVLATPCVTSFITARTSFEVFENILSGSFALLSRPHLLDSLKSSLICETVTNWHLIDWWNSSHSHVYFSR